MCSCASVLFFFFFLYQIVGWKMTDLENDGPNSIGWKMKAWKMTRPNSSIKQKSYQ